MTPLLQVSVSPAHLTSISVILFRLYPRLTKPTPSPFLTVQGVPLDNKESTKILQGDDSVTTTRQEAEKT